jgi:hypothetical protein
MLQRLRRVAIPVVVCASGLLATVGVGAVTPASAPTGRVDLPWLHWDAQLRGPAARTAGVRAEARAPEALVATQRLDPLVSGEGAIGDNYATSVAFDGDTLAVGVPDDIVVASGEPNGMQGGAVLVYRRVTGNWTLEAKLTANDANAGALFGWALALEGDRLVIGAPRAADGATADTGAAYVFDRSAGVWSQSARLRPPTPVQSDRFGLAVAFDGDRAVIGAPQQDAGAVADAGAAHVFTRIAGLWSWQAELTAPLAAANDRFGDAVAIDGGVILAGTPRDEEAGGAHDAGTVHVFVGAGSSWNASARLDVAGAGNAALIGTALALDGARAIVGAPGETVNGGVRGAVYVFARAGSTFGAPTMLVAPDGLVGDRFGEAVAIDGSTLLAGAPNHLLAEGAGYAYVDGGAGFAFQAKLWMNDGGLSDRVAGAVAVAGDLAILGADIDDVPPNRSQGTVQVFARGGTLWTRQPQLDTGDGAGFELHGFGIALDRGTIAVGAFLDDTIAAADDAGSVDVFRNGATGYERIQRLEPSDAQSEDRFGISTALRADTLLAGAYFNIIDGLLNRGSVYVYERQAGSWTQAANLTALGGENAFFGFAVAFDGTRALIGTPGDDEANFDAGAAFVFRRDGANWVQEAKLLPTGSPEEAFAGIAVALAGDWAFVGAPESTVGGVASQGRVYAYRRDGTSWSLQHVLEAGDGAEDDRFGSSLAATPNALAIGASGVSSVNVEFHGAAYVYTSSGSTWTATPRVLPPVLEDRIGFGIAVALDGERLLVGASGKDSPTQVDQGEAYLYARDGNAWDLTQTLAPSTPGEFQFFGRSLLLDYATILVGAPERAGANPQEGAAYVFRDDDRIFADGIEP